MILQGQFPKLGLNGVLGTRLAALECFVEVLGVVAAVTEMKEGEWL